MDDLTRPMTTGQWVLFFLVCLIVIVVATGAIALMVWLALSFWIGGR